MIAGLAFSANAFKADTLDEALSCIAHAGYSGVELMADAPHLVPLDLQPADLRALAARIGDAGLRVSNVNAFTGFARGNTYDPTWISDEPAERQWRIDHTRAAIALAHAVGAPTISLQPGGPVERVDRSVALQRFADGLRDVLPAAAEAGVILGVEPEPGLAIESLAEWNAFLADHSLEHPALGMNCDLGHHFCVGEDPAGVLLEAARQICHVHLEDINADRVHQHLIPGDGAMDFPAIAAALAQSNYAGWVTVELYPYVSTAAQTAQTARERIYPCLAAAGVLP